MQPIAKKLDKIIATDIHLEVVGNSVSAIPNPFNGVINGALSKNVKALGQPVAVVGSTAENSPKHSPKAGSFQKQPSDKATIVAGSSSVLVNGKAVARGGSVAMTCCDPADLPNGKVITTGTVLIGD